MRTKLILIVLALMAVLLLSAAPGTEAKAESGFRALSGTEAAAFNLPGDVAPVRSFTLANGLTYERYQQLFGGAQVLGGQLTLYQDGDGTVVAVIGAHYPHIQASNSVNLTAAAARQASASDIGPQGERLVQLQIDPASGRYFYAVETRRAASRWIHWINAANGQMLNKFNAVAHNCDGQAAPCGYGVQYTEDPTDVKDLTGLTTLSGGEYLLLASDSRQETHDQGSTRRPFLGPVAADADDSWVLLGDESPAQQALVDAHYYANVTDDYYLGVYGYDWVAEATLAGANDRMEVHAHYSVDYNNAFWNGSYIALGDGDQVNFEELTALDVIGHELTHGVTDFTSDLIYQDESGALNEAFSDIMGSSMEFWAEANGSEPATTLQPDWLIGEDFDLRPGENGFRNMADPGEDGDPSHYDERYTGSDDNGGVHTNSGIANHWFYLLVNGGQNADPTFASGTDISGIGLTDAEAIAFLGFTALPADATFCDARAGTIAVAGSYDVNVADAWDEVGVDTALCGGGGDSAPSTTITNPTNGATVFGTVSVMADASDDNGVTQVEFFVDGSSIGVDSDGSDGWSASWDTTAYADGAYTVSATATDTAGQTASDSISVSVDNGSSSDPISLSVTAYKVRGSQHADLEWSGATSTNVDVYRNGSEVATTANDGFYTDITGQKGGGSATYQVCEADTTITTCSNEVNVSW
jgi:Zn-dependent metalloprotease